MSRFPKYKLKVFLKIFFSYFRNNFNIKNEKKLPFNCIFVKYYFNFLRVIEKNSIVLKFCVMKVGMLFRNWIRCSKN